MQVLHWMQSSSSTHTGRSMPQVRLCQWTWTLLQKGGKSKDGKGRKYGSPDANNGKANKDKLA
eukprot:4750527-Amphidinium_carterae.1